MRGWRGKQLRFFSDEKDVLRGIGHSHGIVEYRADLGWEGMGCGVARLDGYGVLCCQRRWDW